MDTLKRGLLALSRAHRANAMSGHLGAAVVAAELLLAERPELPAPVVDGLRGEVARLMAGDEAWFDPDRAGVDVQELFAEAELSGEPVPVDALPAALAAGIDALRQSGHNVIFAALALRALALRPALATADIVEGVQRLLDLFRTAGPGRAYLGADGPWVDAHTLPLPDDSEPYTDETDMVHRTLDTVAAHAREQRRGLGGLHHVINHAAALVDLRRLGYGDLAERGRPVHREHVRRWLALPDLTSAMGAPTPAAADPLTPPYWTAGELERDRALLSHRPKTIYGFETLAAAAQDPERVDAGRDALRYLL